MHSTKLLSLPPSLKKSFPSTPIGDVETNGGPGGVVVGHSNDPVENYTHSKQLQLSYEHAILANAQKKRQGLRRSTEERRAFLARDVRINIYKFERRTAKKIVSVGRFRPERAEGAGKDDDGEEEDDEDDDESDDGAREEENGGDGEGGWGTVAGDGGAERGGGGVDDYGRISTSASLAPAKIKSFLAVQATMDPVEHIKMLQKKLPPLKVSKAQSKECIERIKEKKMEDDVARKEREQRQRKMILNQQAAQKQLEEANIEDLLLQKLKRRSKQEQRIARQLTKVREEKDIIIRNRIFREKQYQELRQREYEKSLEREAEICAQARLEYRDQTKLQMEQYREIRRQKGERKKKEHYGVCADMMHQIFEMAMKISDYRNLNDGVVPPKLLREWKILFKAGKPLDKDRRIELRHDWVQVSCGPESEGGAVGSASQTSRGNGESGGIRAEGAGAPATNVSAGNVSTVASADAAVHVMSPEDILDEQELADDLAGESSWNHGESVPHPFRNEILGRIVAVILDVVAPKETASKQLMMPSVPLKLSVIGKRFSGKSTLADALATTYGLTILKVGKLIDEAIAAFESNEATTASSEAFRGGTSAGTGTAGGIRSGMAGVVGVALVVNTVVKSTSKPATPASGPQNNSNNNTNNHGGEEIATRRPPRPSSVPQLSTRAALGGKIQIALLEGGTPEDVTIVQLIVEAIKRVTVGGWILVNFPQNKTQAQMLEKELTGYEDPKPIKPGGVRRTGTPGTITKEKSVSSAKKKTSLMAPAPTSLSHGNDESGGTGATSPPVSGIDRMIYLEVTNDAAIGRSTGRRTDPLTGISYHMEFNPPPTNVPGLHERLIPWEDDGNGDGQLQYQLAGFEERIGPLREWYSKFQNVLTVPNVSTVARTYDTVNAVLQSMISAQDSIAKIKEKDGDPSAPPTTASNNGIANVAAMPATAGSPNDGNAALTNKPLEGDT